MCEEFKNRKESFFKVSGMSMRGFDKLYSLRPDATRDALICGHSNLNNDRHGLSQHYLYPTWQQMLYRCYGKNYSCSKFYGGKGVRVCFRWLNSFQNFLNDMGEKPVGTTLDRIDPNGWYSPDNCRWVTWDVQGINKTRFTAGNNKYLPGVCRRRNRWQGRIISNNKVLYLGTYINELDAHIAYLKKFKSLHGFIHQSLNPRGISI